MLTSEASPQAGRATQKRSLRGGNLSARRRLKREGNYCRGYLLWATEGNGAGSGFAEAAEHPATLVPASKEQV